MANTESSASRRPARMPQLSMPRDVLDRAYARNSSISATLTCTSRICARFATSLRPPAAEAEAEADGGGGAAS